jgi:hypothetical protein
MITGSIHRVFQALSKPGAKATALGSLTIIPLLIWWAGWYPAIMSSDSIDQWSQVVSFEFRSSHPFTHTAYLWLISVVWQTPAAVALVQIALLAGLLALIARRLVQIGIRPWVAISTVWVIALLPMTAVTTLAIWKDVPFTLAMGWVFTELLLLAADKDRFWLTWHGPLRLGTGLGLMWALRPNGKLTVLVFVVALAIVFRTRWRRLIPMISGVLGVGIVLPAVVVAVWPIVANRSLEPAEVFMPQVGAVVAHARDSLSEDDLILVAAVAPIELWESQYQCGDSSALIFDPDYRNSVIQSDPSSYRSLILRSAVRAPGTVAGHRWCAGEYLLSPYDRTQTYVHIPPFDIWTNDLGLVRAPLSDRAYAATLWAYELVGHPWLKWLMWRPAVAVLFGLITYAAIWWRRKLRPLAWIGLLFGVHLLNVFGTSPTHEFRYAFPLYLISLASAPLWYLIVDPSRAHLGE